MSVEIERINNGRIRCAHVLQQLLELPKVNNVDMNNKRNRLIQDCIKMEYYYKGLIDGLNRQEHVLDLADLMGGDNDYTL